MKRIKNSDMAQTLNGQPQPIQPMVQNAMFYPNTYINFNQGGDYTKHYYNGMERIASRLGDNTTTIALNNNILEDRKLSLEEHFRVDIHKLIYETVPIDMPPFIDVNTLQPTGTPNDIYYYHPNHLGNTAFVTDQNQNITQGFLYAPFGEITTEYNINFGNNTIPKYSFNAKELDEETGMYYYEARYYAPPTFTSRDPLFEKYFWMSPYAYCANNPVMYVDPSGEELTDFYDIATGEHLGHVDDGNDEAIAITRLAFNSLKEENASTSEIIEQGYSLGSNSEFVALAGTLYAESTPGKISFEEMAAIGSVIRNRANANNCSLIDIASGGGIYGYNKRDKINNPNANQKKVNLAYKAAMITLGTKTDYSDGAYYWQGRDFSMSGEKAYKQFYQCGFKFTSPQHDVYKMGDKIGSGKVPYKYESTNAVAGTVFLRLTKEWKKANGATKWNGS